MKTTCVQHTQAGQNTQQTGSNWLYNFTTIPSFAKKVSFLQFQSTPAQGWTFKCQHGPDECSGNKYQACLLNRIQSEHLQTQVIDCMMAAAQPHLATAEVFSIFHGH